ncbi:MAG: hypothetical protein PHC97_04120 [Patescibacteria group bacterium]|nr:hypothetical protein [Patescibacteria group bacterium]
MDNLQAGDVCWQRAKIIKESGDKVFITVNDGTGVLNKDDEMPKKLFSDQFYEDPHNPLLFLRQVRIEEVNKEEGTVLFRFRLDERGQPKGTQPQSVKKEVFLATFFVPGH